MRLGCADSRDSTVILRREYVLSAESQSTGQFFHWLSVRLYTCHVRARLCMRVLRVACGIPVPHVDELRRLSCRESQRLFHAL